MTPVPPTATEAQPIRYGTPRARWVLAATVLGSGMAFLDSTVVNVALPAIADDLHTSITGLQWTVNGYLVTLSALLLLGGTFGDRYGRRLMYVVGTAAFTVASVLCAVAPSIGFLIAARALQGVGAALLVPGSLAIIAATFHDDDRGRAIGAWSGLAGVTSAIGPFLGGWLIDSVSWRLIFVINVPIAAVVVFIAVRHIPESKAPEHAKFDLQGAVLITAALGTLSYAAIEHKGAASVAALVIGLVALVAFIVAESRSSHPMVPLGLFRIAQFTGANLTTLAVYAALGVALFLVVLRLQVSLGYSALEAGAALLPFTVIMLVLSPTAGAIAQKVGPRWPMTIGPFGTAAGMLLFSRVKPGSSYVTAVLPAVCMFGLGMAITVAPLTGAVLGAVDDSVVGVASAINNSVARLAGLVAVAVLPALAGIDAARSIEASIDTGYPSALRIAAAVCAVGGVVSFLFVRSAKPAARTTHPGPFAACQHPAVCSEEATRARAS